MWIIQDGKSPVRSDAYFPEWKPAFTKVVKTCLHEARFPLGEFVRANREKSSLIGWRQTLTTSPANHIRSLLVRAKRIAKWQTGLTRFLAYENYSSRKISPSVRVLQNFITRVYTITFDDIRVNKNRIQLIDNFPYRQFFYVDKFRQQKPNSREEPFKSSKIPKFG